MSHLVWIMGPLSGIVVAPIIGVLSDRCMSSFGRRRPFMLGGLIGCILGMNLFANATAVSFGNLFIARMIAVTAFGVLDFSTNAIMFPSRALLGDLLPAAQQHDVQSAAAVVASISEICAGTYLSSWRDPVTHVSRIFVTASILLVISCTVSLIVCVEKPGTSFPHVALESSIPPISALSLGPKSSPDEHATLRTAEGSAEYSGDSDDLKEDSDPARRTTVVRNISPSGSLEEGFTGPGLEDFKPPLSTELTHTISNAITNFPRPLIRVGVVYGLAWFLWFSSLPFYSQWLGTDVLNGDPHAESGTPQALAYQRGVSVFSLANIVKALLAMIFGAFYPTIIYWIGAIGERVVFGLSFLFFSIILYVCAKTKSVIIAVGVIALGSVPFIVTQTIPIAIVVQRYPENLASNLGVL